jgi:hypothetical protein
VWEETVPGKKITTQVWEVWPEATHVSFSPEPPTPRKLPALLARERVDIGWVACSSAVEDDAFLPDPFLVLAAAGNLAAALVERATDAAATVVAPTGVALGGEIDPEDDDLIECLVLTFYPDIP